MTAYAQHKEHRPVGRDRRPSVAAFRSLIENYAETHAGQMKGAKFRIIEGVQNGGMHSEITSDMLRLFGKMGVDVNDCKTIPSNDTSDRHTYKITMEESTHALSELNTLLWDFLETDDRLSSYSCNRRSHDNWQYINRTSADRKVVLSVEFDASTGPSAVAELEITLILNNGHAVSGRELSDAARK